MSRNKRMSQACEDFWTPRDREPVARQVVGSNETTQDSQETQGSEDYYIPTPAPNVLLPDSLHDINPGEYAGDMDDMFLRSDPDYNAWAGPSGNRGESEGAVAPEVGRSSETAYAPEREADTQAQSTPEFSHHSGIHAPQQRRLRRGQVETISMNFVILYH
jgi:hypothetical protein